MSISNFEIISRLGEGAFSSVHKVKRISDQQVYALKKVKLASLKQKERENSLNEVRILASVNHQNIIAYKEAFIDESTNTLCIVMELAEHGDLLSKITSKKASQTYFPESEIWDVLVQICQGLRTLHESNILHRDLKGANIFIGKEGVIKLGDLNVSKVNKKGLAYTQTGTPYYASPEVWQDKPYDWRSDIWSLGCVIYEMTALSPPFTAADMRGLYSKVINGNYPSIPNRYSADLATVIKAMIQVKPALRPGCRDILSMPEVIRNNRNALQPGNQQIDLLGTIKFESGIKNINKKLPAANYENTDKLNMPRIEESPNPQLKKGYDIFNPRIPSSPKNHLPSSRNDSGERLQAAKNNMPLREILDSGLRKEEIKINSSASPEYRVQKPPFGGARNEIYNNYPEIRPPPSGNNSINYNREQISSSGGRVSSRDGGRPESGLYRAGNIVVQSPKQLLPKGLPRYQR